MSPPFKTPSYELASVSLTKASKPKNGDAVRSRHLEAEKCVLLGLADGVSTCPCDWKASQQALAGIETFLLNSSAEEAFSQRIKKAIRYANQEAITEVGACEGMQTALALVVWDYETDKVYWSNIGDTRIYFYRKERLYQISEDEVGYLNKPTKNASLISGGRPLKEGLTNALGHPNLVCSVHEQSSSDWEGIALASDGLYGVSYNFTEDMAVLMEGNHLEVSLSVLVNNYKDKQRDDLSGVLLRIHREEKDRASILQQVSDEVPPSELSVPVFRLRVLLEEALLKEVNRKNKDPVVAFLHYTKKHGVHFSRAFLGNLMEDLADAGLLEQDMYYDLLFRMRRSKE